MSRLWMLWTVDGVDHVEAVNQGDDVQVVGETVVVSQAVNTNGHQASGRNQLGQSWNIEPDKDRLHLKPEGVDAVVLMLLLDKQVICFIIRLNMSGRASHSDGSFSAS